MTRARLLATVAVLALALRVGFALKYARPSANGGVEDVDQYHSIAVRMLETGEFRNDKNVPTAHREPVYPLVLAGMYMATGPKYWAVVALNILLGVAVVFLTWKLATSLFGETAGWLAAGMAAVHPQLLFYVTEARREMLQTLLLSGAVLAALSAWRRECPKCGAAAGALAALTGLTNSALLPAAAVLAPALWLLGRQTRKATLVPSIACVLAMGALYSVWPARNYLVFQRFIPGITHGGDHLYLGFIIPNDAAGTPEAERIVLEDPVVQRIDKLPDEEKGPAFYQAARDWIFAHPGGFAVRVFQSFVKLWRLYPYARDYGLNYNLIKWVSLLSDGWMIPLGLLGLILAWKRYPETLLPFAVLAVGSLVYSIFWAVIRYRLPFMPLVLAFAAHPLSLLAQRFGAPPGRS